MGDYLQVQEGQRPWRPTPEAKLVTTYNFYNVPTAGVLEHHGANYLFFCVEGIAHPASVWVYTFADDRAVRAFEELPDEQLRDALIAFMADHPSVVAIALEGAGIIRASYQEPRSEVPPMKLVQETVSELLRQLEDQFERPLASA